jgi:hypothetical protein
MEFCPPETDLAAFLKVGYEPSSTSSGVSLQRDEPSASQSQRGSSSSGVVSQRDEPSASRAKHSFRNELVDDIVKLCNQASRDGVGDLVWLGYNPPEKDQAKQTRSPKFKYGTQCVALGRRAAAGLLDVLGSADWRPGHLDDTLKHFCIHNQSPQFGCCWVWPPVGSFRTHPSECVPNMGVRPGGWDDKLRCPFVRPIYDPNHDDRQLYRFVKKGHAQQIRSLSNTFFESDTEGLWRSFKCDIMKDFAWPKTRSSREVRRVRMSVEFRHWVTSAEEVGWKSVTHPNQSPRRWVNPI